jgi:hypothetical protein
MRKHGSPHFTTRVVDTDINFKEVLQARLFENAKQSGECIESGGTDHGNGYKTVMVAGKRYKAHRLSYELAHGPIPEGLLIRHKCDNPPCINPDHLELGDTADNMSDMVERGRSLVGQRQPNAKLTDSDVVNIIARLRAGERQRHLAREYGVSHTTIYEIQCNKRWTHIPRDTEGRAA